MTAPRITAVKGMNDVLPEEVGRWQLIEAQARRVFALYGYEEARTPLVEETALFSRSIGDTTDVVEKEMYTFPDKSEKNPTLLSLRPEGTASLVRAYIEHEQAAKDAQARWYYLGPMFRYERPQKGRYRQFHQIGAEAFGSADPRVDAELIEMQHRFLSGLGLGEITLRLNSLGDQSCRPAYRQALTEYLTARKEQLCATCNVRLTKNPLRVLDCKNPGCQEIARGAPSILDLLCDACRAHFEAVRAQLAMLGVPVEIDPRIVRGLDYYTRTSFEFVSGGPSTSLRTGLGAQNAVSGGGRYDDLVESLGGPPTPAIGFAAGVERLVLLLDEKAGARRGPEVFLATVGERPAARALMVCKELRDAGVSCQIDPRGGSLKSQLRRADRIGARWAVVLGDRELDQGQVELKDLRGGPSATVPLAGLAQAVLSRRPASGDRVESLQRPTEGSQP